MKYLHIIKFIMIVLIFQSCSFDEEKLEYEDKLVIFASISANFPVIDTVLVSKTAGIQENVQTSDLWIDDARVRLIENSTDSVLEFYNVGPGKYFPISDEASSDDLVNYWNYIIEPGETYRLVVNHNMDSVIAETSVPAEMNIRSADLGDYICPDGSVLETGNIDVNNLDSLSIEQLLLLASDTENFIHQNEINIDTVTYRFGDCFTKSFASYPMFGVDFDSENYQTIKILSYAIDADKKSLEPLQTIGNMNAPSFVDSDSGLFYDYNFNEIRDSVFINLIYDTTLGFRVWKGSYPRTEENIPYRVNPWQWNIEESPTQIMWLYFDYYGLNLMTFKATSESYFEYFSGDPVGQNIYLLPDSNFEGGLGVFYSSFESRFLVYVKRDDDT